MERTHKENPEKRARKKPARHYLLEVIELDKTKSFFPIKATDEESAKEKALLLMSDYLMAVRDVYKTAKTLSPNANKDVGPLLEKLQMDPSFLVQQAAVGIVDSIPDDEGFAQMRMETLKAQMSSNEIQDKPKPVEEFFVWQIREVH